MTPKKYDGTIGTGAVAYKLGVHTSTVRAWGEAGILKIVDVTPKGSFRFDPDDINKLAADMEAYEERYNDEGMRWINQRIEGALGRWRITLNLTHLYREIATCAKATAGDGENRMFQARK